MMSVNCNTNSSDWVANKGRFFLTWGMPAIFMVIVGFMQLPSWLTGVIWAGALSWMGGACLWNARQCGRLHCYFTGPFFLLTGTAALGIGFDWLPQDRMGFYGLGWILLIGTPVLLLLPEWLWGTYRRS